MKSGLSIEMYLGFLLLFLVMDIISIVKYKDKAASRYKSKYARFGAAASYLIAGIALSFFNVFPPLLAIAPALVASAIICYLLFIKYKPDSKQDTSVEEK